MTATREELQFVQIRGSRIGFNKPAIPSSPVHCRRRSITLTSIELKGIGLGIPDPGGHKSRDMVNDI
jgi:hypothetical protein